MSIFKIVPVIINYFYHLFHFSNINTTARLNILICHAFVVSNTQLLNFLFKFISTLSYISKCKLWLVWKLLILRILIEMSGQLLFLKINSLFILVFVLIWVVMSIHNIFILIIILLKMNISSNNAFFYRLNTTPHLHSRFINIILFIKDYFHTILLYFLR